MSKISLIIITIFFVLLLIFIFVGDSKDNIKQNELIQNVEIKDGVQYITINAKGGYVPRVSTAKADIPTKLIIKTDDTYDCSLALVIRQIGYQKMLPSVGEEVIDLGVQKIGKMQGSCSMGMYNFVINFE